MGHLVGKDIYRKLRKKIDNLTTRAPWNEALYAVLRELFSTEEADVFIKMPYGLSSLDRITKIIKYEEAIPYGKIIFVTLSPIIKWGFIGRSTIRSLHDLILGLKKSVHKFNRIKFLEIFYFFADPNIV